jgi:hypothetical protein
VDKKELGINNLVGITNENEAEIWRGFRIFGLFWIIVNLKHKCLKNRNGTKQKIGKKNLKD